MMDILLLPLIAVLAGSTVALLAQQLLYGGEAAHRQLVHARIAGETARGLTFAPNSVLRPQQVRFRLLAALPISAEGNERMSHELARAGWQLRPGEYVGVRLICAALGLVIGLVVLRHVGLVSAFPLVLGTLGTALAGFMGPRVLLSRARDKRLQRIEEELPDALTSIAKALRSGAGILQAIEYAGRETPPPLGPELQIALRDLELGADAEQVFGALAERIGSPDLDIAVTAIMIQRTVGGNLSEILTNVTNTIRSRANLNREVKIITTRQRVTSNMVAAVPVVISVLLLMINPKMAELLFGSVPGRIALGVGVAFEVFGIYLIRKFGRVEI